MILYASKFQLAVGMECSDYFQVVRFADNDYGVYMKRFVNDFGTSLAVRGSEEEVNALIQERVRN